MGAYDSDLHQWAMDQVALLRSGRLQELDIDHLAEEIEGLGRSQRRELVNRLAILLAHLLKWQVQPSFRGKSWELTIREQRRRLVFHLEDNPSLRARLGECIEQGFDIACLIAERETGLGRQSLPASCPWSAEQLFDPEFYPG